MAQISFGQAQTTYESLEKMAEKAIDSGQYDKAIPMLKKLIDADYKKASMYSKLGLIYFYQNNSVKAKENFRLATLFGLDDAISYSNIAAAFAQMSDDENALKYNTIALEKEATPQTVGNQISFLNGLNRHDEALDIYKKYADNDADIRSDVFVTLVIAETNYYLGNYYEAIQQFRRFFAKYYKDKKMDVDINKEKAYYLYSVFMESSDITMLAAPEAENRLLFDEEIYQLYSELRSSPQASRYYEWLVAFADKALIFQPHQKEFFRRLISATNGVPAARYEISQNRITGNYEKALQLIHSEEFNLLGYDKEHIEIGRNIEEYLVLLYRYNDYLTSKNVENKEDMEKMKFLAGKIAQFSKKKSIQSSGIDLTLPFRTTVLFSVNVLHYQQRKDQRDVVRELLRIMYSDSITDWDKLMYSIETKGHFN